jgi:hypothetical protein
MIILEFNIVSTVNPRREIFTCSDKCNCLYGLAIPMFIFSFCTRTRHLLESDVKRCQEYFLGVLFACLGQCYCRRCILAIDLVVKDESKYVVTKGLNSIWSLYPQNLYVCMWMVTSSKVLRAIMVNDV